MWNGEAGSLMNIRCNRAPATSPASCILPSSQSRPRFPAVSHPQPTYATLLHQRGLPVCQPPKYEKMPPLAAINLYVHNSFGALHRLLIHRQTLVPTHACISSNTSRTRPTLINTNTKTNTHIHTRPQQRTRDGRTASFRSLTCKRHGSKHVLPRSICPVGFMPCHQRASTPSDLLGR